MSDFFIKVTILAIGLILGVTVFFVPYLNQIAEVKRKSEVKINEQIIVAEVVSKAKEKEQGLVGREGIGINEGMLFLFPNPGFYGFWMKGMKFAIDIIWINGNRVVGVEENISPLDPNVYYPPEPVNKVLEIKSGRAAILRIKAGDEVKIRPLISGITRN